MPLSFHGNRRRSRTKGQEVLVHRVRDYPSEVPLPFHLSYDPAQVQPGHRYSVSARIEVNGELLFITTENHAVQLDGRDPQPL